jgi:VCBS repeat-containing protein
VLSGTNTWTGGGSVTVNTSVIINSGAGGLLVSRGLLHFDGDASLPTGNGGGSAWLAACLRNDSTPYGFMFRGSAGGTVYDLPTGYKLMVGTTASSASSSSGVLGAEGGRAILKGAPVYFHGDTTNSGMTANLLVRPGSELVLGAAGQPTTLYASRGFDASTSGTATSPLDVTTATRTLVARGNGRVRLDNVDYRRPVANTDAAVLFIWQLGVVNGEGTVVRETAVGSAGSLQRNKVVFAGGILETDPAFYPSGTFNRTVNTGTASNYVSASGWMGFAAVNGDLKVDLNTLGTREQFDNLTSGFASGLILGSSEATHTVEFFDTISARYAQFVVQSVNGPAAIEGKISGNLTAGNNSGTFKFTGNGVIDFVGQHNYASHTYLDGGTLLVDGSFNTQASYYLYVTNTAILGGTGTISRTVYVQKGGRLAPGRLGAGTLRVSSVVMDGTAGSDCQMGSSTNDKVAITGNLTLDGSLNISPLAGFTNGTYTLMTYGGTLTDNGLTVGSAPAGYTYQINAAGGVVQLVVTVAGGNVPPAAGNDSYSVDEDVLLIVTAPGVLANDSDTDGGTLSVTLVNAPDQADSFTLNANGSFSYLPSTNYHGPDSFTYRLSDGQGGQATGTVSITVNSINDPPAPQLAAPSEGHTFAAQTHLTVSANCADPDGLITQCVFYADTTVIGVRFACPSSIIWSNVPRGAYALKVVCTDNDGATVESPVVNVLALNNAPEISEGASTSVTMSEDGSPTAFSLTLHATDADLDTLTWSVATNADHGSATASGTGASKAISYTPTANYNGTDRFVVRVTDGQGGSDLVAVDLTINAVNDKPVVTADALTVNEGAAATLLNGGSASVLSNDSDVEGGLTAVLTRAPMYGSLTLNANGTFNYTHNGGETTSDSFEYAASDGVLAATTTVDIVIQPVNDLPVCVVVSPTDGASLALAPSITISANCTDVDSAVTQTLYYVDEVLIGLTVVCPSSVEWLSATPGVHEIRLVCFDNDGGVATSDVVTVTVLEDNDADGIPDVSDPDDDNDGMPDTWEESYGLSSTNENGHVSDDADHDGLCDYFEYVAGTLPNNSNSVFEIAAFSRTNGTQTVVTFKTVADRTYAVDYIENLNLENWQNLTNNVPGSGSNFSFTDKTPGIWRFYRIRVTKP